MCRRLAFGHDFIIVFFLSIQFNSILFVRSLDWKSKVYLYYSKFECIAPCVMLDGRYKLSLLSREQEQPLDNNTRFLRWHRSSPAACGWYCTWYDSMHTQCVTIELYHCITGSGPQTSSQETFGRVRRFGDCYWNPLGNRHLITTR